MYNVQLFFIYLLFVVFLIKKVVIERSFYVFSVFYDTDVKALVGEAADE